jgi:AmiR/NasT family two-component response regulator
MVVQLAQRVLPSAKVVTVELVDRPVPSKIDGQTLRVQAEARPGTWALVTCSASEPEVFGAADAEVATVLAELAAAAMEVRELRRKVSNLSLALETNREIGVAIGILMARRLLTADQAFERLREASQRRHRKLREIAEDVVRTGELPPP